MTDSEELQDLAEMLTRKALWSDARAAMGKHDATINVQKEVVNASYCRRKAEVCKRVAEKLSGPKLPRNKALATVPTVIEWEGYALELKWPHKDAMACFDHFQSNGWRIGGKTPVRDWKAAARNGQRRWQEKHPNATPKGAQTAPDPAGWREWREANGAAYIEFSRATPGTQRAFQERKI